MRKILLNKSRGKQSTNDVNCIPIEFNRDVSLLHDEFMNETFDTMQLYNDEKDNCNKHRLIFTIRPICSNSLYNNITEIIYKEGSDDAVMLTNNGNKTLNSGAISQEDLTRKQAIRNTEYTNDKFNLTYHCGSDIFNNHLLRMKENVSVQKRNSSSTKKCILYTGSTKNKNIDSFNTLGDYSRTFNGNDIKIKLPSSSSNYTYSTTYDGKLSLYTSDTVKTFIDAYSDGIKRNDGWMGFYNQTTISIPVSTDYYVNKCFNNKQGCQFIDMAPERDLFYFTPKKNPYKNRLEYNWKCFITYPYKSIYNYGNILNNEGLSLASFGDDKMYHEYAISNGLTLALFRSPVKHNLSVGETVRLIFPSDTGRTLCRVVKLGNGEGKYPDRYFSVMKSDFEHKNGDPIRFTKCVNGNDCEYYLRKFKKINNEYLNEPLKSTINKLAFSETVYGDEVSQLVFTDDIDTTYLFDNRGRPLTELYLTIIKTNNGHKGWYESGKCSDYSENNKLNTVEYSHVFGPVTSGLDLPTYAGKNNPTVRYQHNINSGRTLTINTYKVCDASSVKFYEGVNGSNEEITPDFDEFYGDLVEFNPSTLNETILEDVYHRFNTAQREYYNSKGSMYDTVYHDEVLGDMYDGDRYGTSSVSGQSRIREYKINEKFGNLAPEGYIYKPHYRIKIGEFSNIIKNCSDIPLNTNTYSFITNESYDYDVIFYTEENYKLMYGDIITFLNKDTKRFFHYRIIDYKLANNEKGVFEGKAAFHISPYYEPNDKDRNGNILWFIHDITIPHYGLMLPDGSGRYTWREIKKSSEYNSGEDLYNIPYTNDAFYYHENIDFFVKRQDPFGHYEMYVKNKDGFKIDNNFEVPTIELDKSGYEHIPEINGTSCF